MCNTVSQERDVRPKMMGDDLELNVQLLKQNR